MGTNLRQRNDGGLDFVSDSTGNAILSVGVSGNPIVAESAADALTAHAGGGQASALQLTAAINRVTTVASAADSVKLPLAVAGISITVINAAASNSMQVFGTSPDTINGVATGTGVALVAGKTATFFTTIAGAWHMQLSA